MNDVKVIYKKIIKEIKEYFQKNNVKKAVIGLSGGIDSSLVTAILQKQRMDKIYSVL